MERVSLVDLLWSTDISDEDFYQAMGIDSTTWVNWAFGAASPNDEQKTRMARILRTTPETIEAAVFTAESGIFEVNYYFQQDRIRHKARLRAQERARQSKDTANTKAKNRAAVNKTIINAALAGIAGFVVGLLWELG